MALVITVTKEAVQLQRPNLYHTGINLLVTDNAVEVINQIFQVNHNTGQDLEPKIKDLKNQMQAVIDDYVAEQVVYNHAKLDNAITWLNNNLSGGA